MHERLHQPTHPWRWYDLLYNIHWTLILLIQFGNDWNGTKVKRRKRVSSAPFSEWNMIFFYWYIINNFFIKMMLYFLPALMDVQKPCISWHCYCCCDETQMCIFFMLLKPMHIPFMIQCRKFTSFVLYFNTAVTSHPTVLTGYVEFSVSNHRVLGPSTSCYLYSTYSD